MADTPQKPPYLVLYTLALAHSLLTLAYALTRIYAYKASLLDIGLFDQLLWNLQHTGAPVTTATLPFTPQHWLGFHFSPLLFALLPFYALWPHMELFQVVQSLCFGLAGIPLFFAITSLGVSRAGALAFTLLYWASPLVLSAAIWDFHEIAFSTLFIAMALHALCAKRFAYLLLSLFLLLLTKEHYGVTVAGFGFLWGWHHRDWKRGTLLMILGVAAIYCVLTIIMPHFSGGAHPMFSDEGNVISRYGWMAAPWAEKFQRLFGIFFGDGTPQVTGILHIFLLLLSGLLLPLLAPLYLAPAAADILANLLSSNPMPRHIASYHAAACIPVILLTAAQGYFLTVQKLPRIRIPLIAASFLLAVVLPATSVTTLPFSIWELSDVSLKQDARQGDIAVLIQDAPVSAQANIGMFFSQREAIYPFPHMLDRSNFVVLYLKHPFADVTRSNFNIPYGTDTAEFVKDAMELLGNKEWGIIYWNEPWLVLKRGERINDAVRDAQVQRALSALNVSPPAP